MKKLRSHLTNHWPQSLALLCALVVIAWLAGCPPRATSPIDPTQKLTRAQLAVELDNLVARYELADADIAQQERIRQVIINNALLMAQTGTFNPLGIITGLAALYGLGSAGNSVKNKIKNKKPTIPVET